MAERTSVAIKDVVAERLRQDVKWGQQRHPLDTWATVLMEEVGEFAQDVLKGRVPAARGELVQVAAVAVAAIEFIDSGAEALPRMNEDARTAADAEILRELAERTKRNPWPPTFAHVARWVAAAEIVGRVYIPSFPLATLTATSVSGRVRCPSCDAAMGEACRG